MDVGSRIVLLIKKSGLTQKEFAEKIGLKKNAISQWKSGNSKSYNKYLKEIAEILNTTTEYLLTGKEVDQNGLTTVSDDEAALDEELVSRLCRLTPEECVKVDVFVQGLLAAREADASPPKSNP